MLIVLLAGCENKDQDKKVETMPDSHPGKSVLFKGMCTVTDTMRITECGTKRNFQIAPDGNITMLKEVIEMVKSNPDKKQIYIEAEGFTSYAESENNFDTLLIVTRFTRYDTAYNCIR